MSSSSSSFNFRTPSSYWRLYLIYVICVCWV